MIIPKQLLSYIYHLRSLSMVYTKSTSKYLRSKKVAKKQQTPTENISKMIQTFVFLDLETTGLLLSNVPPPRITEIGMVAVIRDSLCNNSNKHLARIKYKLVIPMNPVEDVTQKVEELTGLSNNGLQQLQPFSSNTKTLLSNFLQQLKGPICFVAHNGNRFDYPILLSELQKIGMLEYEETLYTVDSLHFFKYYFRTSKEQVKENFEKNVLEKSVTSETNVLLNDGYDSVLSNALDNYTNSVSEGEQTHETKVELLNSSESPTKLKNSTPRKVRPYNYCEEMQKINEKTPENQIIKSDSVRKNLLDGDRLGARRKLQFQCSTNTLSNYKLATIYEFIFGTKSDDNHTAEGDCITLLQCAMKVGNVFVEWADDHAVNLYSHQRS